MTQGTNPEQPVEPDLLTIKQAAAKLGLSAWTIYKLLDASRLDGVYQGARRYVVAESIPVYIASLSSTPAAPESA